MGPNFLGVATRSTFHASLYSYAFKSLLFCFNISGSFIMLIQRLGPPVGESGINVIEVVEEL